MLLNNYNFEFPGLGVAIFSVLVFITLLFWNAYHKTGSELAKTIKWYLIVGIIYGGFNAAFVLTQGLDPEFYLKPAAVYDLLLLNLSSVFMILFNVVYIRKKTSKDGKARDPLSFLVYAITALLAVGYVFNALYALKNNGVGLINYLTADGIYTGTYFYRLSLYFTILIMCIPFIFIIQGWKRAIPKERILLIIFAAIPWGAYVFKLMVYNRAEMDANFACYAILGILMVFFDRIALDTRSQRQKEFAEKLAQEAMLDKVTRLTSGDIFERQVEEELATKGSQGSCLALISIDKYQEFNTIYGRQFCDEIMREAAKNLKEAVRPDDLTGRIGTEEFAVFFRCEVRFFDGLISKMRDKLDFVHDGVGVSVTVGAARVTDNDSDYDYLMALADKTLRNAKRDGGGTYRLVNR